MTDIGRCDLCGDEDGHRFQRWLPEPYRAVAWVCIDCSDTVDGGNRWNDGDAA